MFNNCIDSLFCLIVSGGCCDHSSGPQAVEDMGVQYSLYQKIDLDEVECLNESSEKSGKTVFKPWEQRLDREKVRSLYGHGHSGLSTWKYQFSCDH